MTDIVGTYINRETGKNYTVEKHTQELTFQPLNSSEVTRDGSYSYTTSCGIDVEPLGDDLASFELIQIDGVIHRVTL